jgi:hypothetical protein
VTMTWDKFSKTVLPDGGEHRVPVPNSESHRTSPWSLGEATPTLRPNVHSSVISPMRNPVTWYVYQRLSAPAL